MKNPFLSFWLSGANAAASASRGFWAGEMQRQQTAMLNEMTKQMVRFWTGAWMMPGLQAKTSQRGSRRS
jgi:hypothetical protein